jgi:hypothetical protein
LLTTWKDLSLNFSIAEKHNLSIPNSLKVLTHSSITQKSKSKASYKTQDKIAKIASYQLPRDNGVTGIR